ncbi:MAG: RES family NAD+ phosphorylase [Acidobacteria bacterium]|nr:RES family NAD+ phosphorylase [Acidobacteriota bacterium]
MMRVWRICPERYAEEAFSGAGGLRHGARWHPKGTRVVYTSQSLSLAALEFFVNLDVAAAGVPLVAMSAEIPGEVKVLLIRPEDLPAGWRSYPAREALQAIGSRWVATGHFAVLSVPSALIPAERNYLLNPLHPRFRRIVISKPEPFAFDPRIWKPGR